MSESHGMYSIFGEKLKVVGPPKKSGKKTNGHGRKFLPPRPLYPKPLADGINKETSYSATKKCARRFCHQQFSLLSKQKGFSSP
jgi:hypothetical protein